MAEVVDSAEEAELRGTRDWRERLDDLGAARERGVVFSSVCLIDDRFIGDPPT